MDHRIHTESDLDAALANLVQADPRFGSALALAGRPPLRRRADGFAGLAQIVVSQQLSTASARAIWGRLEARSTRSTMPPCCAHARQSSCAQVVGTEDSHLEGDRQSHQWRRA